CGARRAGGRCCTRAATSCTTWAWASSAATASPTARSTSPRSPTPAAPGRSTAPARCGRSGHSTRRCSCTTRTRTSAGGCGWLAERLAVYGFFARPASWRYLTAKRRAVQALRRRRDRDLVPFLSAHFRFGPVATPAVRVVLDPLFSAYFRVVKRLIVW